MGHSLGHSPGSTQGITAIYNRHRYGDEKRQALAAWGRELELGKVGPRPPRRLTRPIAAPQADIRGQIDGGSRKGHRLVSERCSLAGC